MSSAATPRVLLSAGASTKTSDYVHSLETSGAQVVVVRPADVRPSVDGFDAVVFSGGPDVDPARFDFQTPPELVEAVQIDHERDAMEWELLDAVERLQLPVLAICRGVQLVNAYRGGTLRLDLPSQGYTTIDHRQRDRRSELVHEVLVEEGTRLREVVGAARLQVNSIHHQAILDPAPDLRITAHAPDGVVEGLESSDGRLIGVQWHPELLFDQHAAARALFADLLARVEARATTV